MTMKRWIGWTVGAILAVIALSYGAILQQQYARHATASSLSIAAATSDENVTVTFDHSLTLRPKTIPERMGLIFYPGAYTDLRGYAPTLKPLAAAGYRVIVVPMPFELAILGIDRANDVIAANPDLKHWVIIGHSVGGAAGAVYANEHRASLDGVVIWDSFPPSFASLADFPKPVWHIHRAKLDGAPPDSFMRQRALFPPSSRWVPIPGGIHMYFGSFTGGGYQEDWPPEISEAQQHVLVIAGTLEALADIEQANKPTTTE
jgi:hypothetical protein